jgi:hypothetical protein
VADVPSGLSFTSPQQTIKSSNKQSGTDIRHNLKLRFSPHAIDRPATSNLPLEDQNISYACYYKHAGISTGKSSGAMYFNVICCRRPSL